MPYAYQLVDVFASEPFGGNPLAVFPDARDIPSDRMAKLARELNLSETTFVLPPEDSRNDYRVRIFTPAVEMPIAGHPTIGTAFVLASLHTDSPRDGMLSFRFEEGVGPVPVTVEMRDGAPGRIWMEQPVPTFAPRPEDPAVFAELLSLPAEAVVGTGLPVEVGSCGVPFLYVPLGDLAAVRRAKLRLDIADRLPADAYAGQTYVFTLEVEHPDSLAHARMFAPGAGIMEDPATGAASGPAGAYLVRHGMTRDAPTARITLEQGIEMGRPSRIEVEIEHDAGDVRAVRVGGLCVPMGNGRLTV